MKCVSLSDLLHTQSIPISEKQFWAVSYSLLMLWNKTLNRNGYSYLLEPCFSSCSSVANQSYHFNITVKADKYDELESSSSSVSIPEVYHDTTVYPNLSDVMLCENGCVFLSPNSKKAKVDERVWLQEYGYLLYLCLDFGLAPDQERSLSKEVSDFVSFLTESNNLDPTQSILFCFKTASQHCQTFNVKSIISDMVRNVQILQQHLDVLRRLGVDKQKQQQLGDRGCSLLAYEVSQENLVLWKKVNDEFLNFDRHSLRAVPKTPRRSFQDTSLHGQLMMDIRRGHNLKPVMHERAASDDPEESTWGLLMRAVRQFAKRS